MTVVAFPGRAPKGAGAARDIWIRFMAPTFLIAAILLLAVAMLLTSPLA